MMLQDSPVVAILPAQDLNRAKELYQNKLGLELNPMSQEDLLIFDANKGTSLIIYYRPERIKAEHTVAGFMVNDIEDTIEKLKIKGVKFEDYDRDNLKTINHIMDYGANKSAWFKDSEGNILALSEM